MKGTKRRKITTGKNESGVARHESELEKFSDEELLRHYFQLDFCLPKFYEVWSEKDPNFKEVAKTFYGVRILKQDPVENIFSFICSSNNNISR